MSNLVPSIDGGQIRKEWHENQWYYSIIDMIAVLLDADLKTARNYYHVLKGRLTREGNQTLTNCKRLKLIAEDGRRRETDVVNTEEALRVIQSIPSSKLEPLKLWLALVGRERLDESADPELGLFRSFERTIADYRSQGKSESWIEARVQGIVTRKQFVEALAAAVLQAPTTIYVEATENLYKGLWQRTTAQLRGELKISQRENPRDHFGEYALIYTRLAEKLASEKLGQSETIPMSVAMEIVWEVAKMMGKQAREVSEALGYDLVTDKPLLQNKKSP
ncbi:MAG: hypothetical protein KF716_06415 [Anaerolineae bacterium]|nr:hypothetical protein [Anaerolineae bacterium]